MILLDTHVLVWSSLEPSRIGPQASAAMQEGWSANAMAVSSISFWEVAMLVERGRLRLNSPIGVWREQWLAEGLRELPLDGSVAIAGAQLQALHADLADRWIVASALAAEATLITADKQLLCWEGLKRIRDARL